MPKFAVIDNTTGDVRGVIMTSPSDSPYKGTKLIQIHDKAHIDTRFSWTAKDGFQPKQSYLDEITTKTSDPLWKADKPDLTLEWDATLLTFVYKDIV